MRGCAMPGHELISGLRRSLRAIEARFEAASGPDGLTVPQYLVLRAIAATGGLSQTEVVLETGIDRSTVADIVRRISTRSLIRQVPAVDGRVRHWVATEEGKAALRTAERDMEAILKDAPPEAVATLATITEAVSRQEAA